MKPCLRQSHDRGAIRHNLALLMALLWRSSTMRLTGAYRFCAVCSCARAHRTIVRVVWSQRSDPFEAVKASIEPSAAVENVLSGETILCG